MSGYKQSTQSINAMLLIKRDEEKQTEEFSTNVFIECCIEFQHAEKDVGLNFQGWNVIDAVMSPSYHFAEYITANLSSFLDAETNIIEVPTIIRIGNVSHHYIFDMKFDDEDDTIAIDYALRDDPILEWLTWHIND
jgi:hypothetical protein